METNEAGRIGDWMLTYTGKHFWPLDPRPEDIDIRDIIHHLAMTCRWGGATKFHYSVAQHCVLVCDAVFWRSKNLLAPPDICKEWALWGLLHDASEAYLGDMVRPLKRQPGMGYYRLAEEAVMKCVCSHFGMSYHHMPEVVKKIDNALIYTEARDLIAFGNREVRHWDSYEEPLPAEIRPWSIEKAKYEFSLRFQMYVDGRILGKIMMDVKAGE